MSDPLPPSPDVPALTAAMLAPPTDVEALLKAVGVAGELSVYFDAQQRTVLQEAQQQWPALWRMAFAGA